MELHYKTHIHAADAPWLILIHGLFGSADNLAVIRRHFESTHNIISVDLPNHGLSPWVDSFNFNDSVTGLIAILDSHGIKKTAVLGHSLGGKVAMQLALAHGERVSHLLVADIAPVAYEHRHQSVFDGLNAVELSTITGRKDAELAMAAHIQEAGVRQFLLKSLYQNDQKQWLWRFNVRGLIESYPHIIDWPQTNQQFNGITYFIKGGQSDYITAQHREAIAQYFPNAKAHIIEGTGHWLHAEKPTAFNAIVSKILAK